MALLEIDNIEQSYGGLDILQGISLKLITGERKALIGPNGAGKTTFFEVLSGFVPPKAGRIRFLDYDITHLPPNDRTARGLARSFQITTLLPALTVQNNVLLAIHGVQPTRYQMFRALSSYKDNLAIARELLEMVDLWDKRDSLVSELSYGQQRQIDLILALASKPKLLLLDEPNAGLTKAESSNIIDLIEKLVGDTAVLLTAHDMDLVVKIANSVAVLYYGKIIAEGTPEQIQADSKVREIYLGVEKKTANA